jgi:hypothetical protein
MEHAEPCPQGSAFPFPFMSRLNSLNRLARALAQTHEAEPASPPAPPPTPTAPPPSRKRAAAGPTTPSAKAFNAIGDGVLSLMVPHIDVSDMPALRREFIAWLEARPKVSDWRKDWPAFLAARNSWNQVAQAAAAVAAAPIKAALADIPEPPAPPAPPKPHWWQQRRRIYQTGFTPQLERTLV